MSTFRKLTGLPFHLRRSDTAGLFHLYCQSVRLLLWSVNYLSRVFCSMRVDRLWFPLKSTLPVVSVKKGCIRKKSLAVSELINCQLWLVVEVIDAELRFLAVKIVIGSSAKILGKTTAVRTRQLECLRHFPWYNIVLLWKPEITIVFVVKVFCPFKLTIILPIYPGFVDVVSIGDKGQLFLFIKPVVITSAGKSIFCANSAGNFAKGPFWTHPSTPDSWLFPFFHRRYQSIAPVLIFSLYTWTLEMVSAPGSFVAAFGSLQKSFPSTYTLLTSFPCALIFPSASSSMPGRRRSRSSTVEPAGLW